ncbi:predicted protein [Scheffersomyces stipitis CBS 6054]|uniref:Uncharacterized protein n=1 Tax=Scheffersomyces stipitis (strain ATCC 58785 / CBS 6054 / NBRC 10063 / NRRL Y-11545) TaxID=322104 RepID=A3LQT6_PICST|nr:predicted protein [Scheffersomyces stipitis CBS 6054]ABN65263.2 predicted protein [Scheffersomyces stipitis CBS 6054]
MKTKDPRMSFRISKSRRKPEIPGTSVISINEQEIPGSSVMSLDYPSKAQSNKGTKSLHATSYVFAVDRNAIISKKKIVPGTSIIRIIQKRDNYINSDTGGIKYPEMSGKRIFANEVEAEPSSKYQNDSSSSTVFNIENMTDFPIGETTDFEISPSTLKSNLEFGSEFAFAIGPVVGDSRSRESSPRPDCDRVESTIVLETGSRKHTTTENKIQSVTTPYVWDSSVTSKNATANKHHSAIIRTKQQSTFSVNLSPHTNSSPGRALKFKLREDKREKAVPGTSIIFENNEITNLSNQGGKKSSTGLRLADQGTKAWQVFTTGKN